MLGYMGARGLAQKKRNLQGLVTEPELSSITTQPAHSRSPLRPSGTYFQQLWKWGELKPPEGPACPALARNIMGDCQPRAGWVEVTGCRRSTAQVRGEGALQVDAPCEDTQCICRDLVT